MLKDRIKSVISFIKANKLASILLAGAVVILVTLVLVLFLDSKEKNLEVSFLDIGQGDAVLVESPLGKNILIDGGPDNEVVYELGKNLGFWDKQIDLMILTHPHADHVTGLIEVLKRYRVKRVLSTGVLHTSPVYLEFLAEIKKQEIVLTLISQKQKIRIENDIYLDIVWPQEDLQNKEVSNLNNTSIVAKLVYGNTSFLFTGDIEEETEGELVQLGENLKTDVLKLGHHGSDTSTTDNFLKAASPSIGVITYGLENKFGFPKKEVMDRLLQNNIKILKTDIGKTIMIKSNGKQILIK